MKVVIDIAEETYINVKSIGLFLCPRDKTELEKAIKFAMPYEERPQGEWTNKHFEHADCSLCGRTNDYHGDFCKYCGADMRKGGAE